MFCLWKSALDGHTVVFESVGQGKAWLFKPGGHNELLFLVLSFRFS